MLNGRSFRSLVVVLGLTTLAEVALGQTAEVDPVETALDHLRAESFTRSALGPDDTTIEARDLNTTRRGEVTSVWVRQRLAGIEIHGADVSVVIAPDGRVLQQHESLSRRSQKQAPSPQPSLSARDAIESAANHLQLERTAPLEALTPPVGAELATRFSRGGLSLDEIPARLNYVPTSDGPLRLAWNLVLRVPSNEHWWNLLVDAENGEILERYDWVRRDSYRVFELPLESPDEGVRTLATDPADATASPYGWHDTDGLAGAESSQTVGNNAETQEDTDGNDFGGLRPSGGAGLDFEFPLDLNQPPGDSQEAAITQLFYSTNRAHDIFYAYGFDEASGNFQRNNYGRGGLAGDPVIADAQDGAGMNNARFGSPPDGTEGRMEMFLFDEGSNTAVIVNSPAGLGILAAGPAEFGPTAGSTGHPGPGNLVRAVDAANAAGPTTLDGCSPLLNPAEISGNIALIDRGACFFVEKVVNAQNAGAIGVVIANNAGNSVITMAGSDPSIAIPALFIGQGDGAALASQLQAGNAVNVTLQAGVYRDGAFDTGIVVHEYGHGVSSRLAGGPSNANCLFSAHGGGMGEGWSDFFGLALTAKPGDQGSDSRPIGTFVLEQTASDAGIRSHPYDTDLADNPLTFADIATQFQPHGTGEVWAVTLWDLYWILVAAYGFDADLVGGDGGNNRVLQLVVDALKLQSCEPTFLEGRDAILLADAAAGGADECFIWTAFAKRGMGTGASDGGVESSLSVTENFSRPAQCAEFCGDGIVQAGETCEDGNLLSLDGCSVSCQEEIRFEFAGTASGGTVAFTISGETVQIPTSPGESAATVATHLAAALASNAALQALGVFAAAVGNELVTDGSLDAFAIDDEGLAPPVPGLPPSGVAGLALALVVLGIARLGPRRARRNSVA